MIVRQVVSGFVSWPQKTYPPNPMPFNGVSIDGVHEDPELPGFCAYFGLRNRKLSVSADYERAHIDGRLGMDFEMIIEVNSSSAVRGDSFQLWADGNGDVLDIRAGRCQAEFTGSIASLLDVPNARHELSAHPRRFREVAAAPNFRKFKAFIWEVRCADTTRPMFWLRAPLVQSIEMPPGTGLDIVVPPAEWEGWDWTP